MDHFGHRAQEGIVCFIPSFYPSVFPRPTFKAR